MNIEYCGIGTVEWRVPACGSKRSNAAMQEKEKLHSSSPSYLSYGRIVHVPTPPDPKRRRCPAVSAGQCPSWEAPVCNAAAIRWSELAWSLFHESHQPPSTYQSGARARIVFRAHPHHTTVPCVGDSCTSLSFWKPGQWHNPDPAIFAPKVQVIEPLTLSP